MMNFYREERKGLFNFAKNQESLRVLRAFAVKSLCDDAV